MGNETPQYIYYTKYSPNCRCGLSKTDVCTGVDIAQCNVLHRMTEKEYKEKIMAKDCGCGRSPTGKCIGWHGLTNEDYAAKLAEHNKKQLTEDTPKLLTE
jgi:hypothetical protein